MRILAHRSCVSLACAVALCGFSATPALAERPCPPDINCTGAVDVDDLLSVITSWGPGGGAADVNNSGSVDVDDLLAVITSWGDCRFNFNPVFPNAEAHQIGLEMLGANGPLSLPQATYDRIVRDLGIIRTAVPPLAAQPHSMAWAPNQFIVAVIQGQPTVEYQCLNTFYQVTNSSLLFSSGGIDYFVLTLAGRINIPALSAIYTALPEVSFAEPDGLIGGQNFWVPTDLGNGTWRWNIDDGFTDCFDGCDCHRFYEIDINAAGAIVSSSCEEFGAKWCEFGGPGCDS